MGDKAELVPTGVAVRTLGISGRTLTRYVERGLIKPDLTLPSGRYRWDVERLRAQIKDLASVRTRRSIP